MLDYKAVKKRPLFIWSAFGLLLGITSWLLAQNNITAFFQSDDTTFDQNDTYLVIQNVHLRRYDDTGNLTMIVQAARAYQDKQDLPLELQSVTVTSHTTENGQSLKLATINSQYAIYNPLLGTLSACMQRIACANSQDTLADNRWLLKDEESSAELVELKDFSTSPMTLVKSPLLLYDIQTRMVTNNEPTSIQQGKSIMTGKGLKADLPNHHYQLMKDIEASFIDETIKADNHPTR